ncbi:MAG: prepilin peptidase, partial [Pseudomonadota bacterium]|nr:prepilin peptidase [Pseudomonadota bacterium]
MFIAAWFLPLMLAPFIGSFLGVLIVRLPTRTAVVMARSACPKCGHRLGITDLIPVLSFLLLRGRCRYCRQPIALYHPTVELAAVGVVLWAWWSDPDATDVWLSCALGWTLLALAWIDWTEFQLPDVLTLPLLLIGLTLTSVRQPQALTDHCLAAAFGYLSFQGLALGYRRLRGHDGLGGGDAKLIASAGAWCGLAALPLVVLGSAMLGLLLAFGLALAGRTVRSRT